MTLRRLAVARSSRGPADQLPSTLQLQLPELVPRFSLQLPWQVRLFSDQVEVQAMASFSDSGQSELKGPEHVRHWWWQSPHEPSSFRYRVCM